MVNKPRQLIRFLAVGMANTVLDFGLFNLLVLLTKAQDIYLVFFNVISITLAALQSFFLHRIWTFSSQDKALSQLGRFALSTAGGIVLNTLVVFIVMNLNKYLGLPSLLALNGGKVFGACLSASWNFLWYKHWVFATGQPQTFPQENKNGLVSVIIPAYNEEERIEARLATLTASLPTYFPTEIIVVDDGSLDGTRAIAQNWADKYPFVRVLGYKHNSGKGQAVKEGMYGARGEYLVFADADSTFSPEQINKVVEALAGGAQVVIGKRECGNSRLVGESWLRELMGKVFNSLVQLFFLPGIGDSQCGLKGFSREAARELFSKQRLTGFSFDVELISLARAQRMKIQELPIAAEAAAGSKVCMTSTIQMAWELFLLKTNQILNRYGLAETREKYIEAALVIGLFSFALVARLPYLWEVPRYIDELGEVNLAYQIFQGQARPLHNAAHDIGAFHNYLLAGIFKLFGPSIWWPRLYVAITSALTVVLVYYLGKLLFDKKSGFLAAALLAANGMHILVTHMAWSNSTTPFFFALALYVTLVAEKKESSVWLVLAGFLWAMALQTHSSVIIYVLVVASYLTGRIYKRKTKLGRGSLLAAASAFVVGYANMIYFNLLFPLGSITWLGKKGYTLEQGPGLLAFCQNAGKMLVQFLRTISSSYPELANPLAYLKYPQFSLALAALLGGWYLTKKEGKVLPLWLIGGSFAAIPWLNSRYSFYLPTRYIMPVVLLGVLLVAKGIIAGASFLFKDQAAQRYAWAGCLVFVAIQLVPHYRYCQELRGTNQANTMALEIVNNVKKVSGGREIILVDGNLPLENRPLQVLFGLAGQPQAELTAELPVGEISPKLAVLSSSSYARLKKIMPLRVKEQFTSRVLSAGKESKRVIYLVEFIDAPGGIPVGGSR